LWVSIVLKLLLPSSFLFIKVFPFHWFFFSMFSKFWWFSIIVNVYMSICNQCFQFNVANVFFNVIVLWLFQLIFSIFYWCFQAFDTMFLFLSFHIWHLNILCSILQMFLFSSNFYFKIFPFFSLQMLLGFFVLIFSKHDGHDDDNISFCVMLCVFYLCRIIFVCILFCTNRLLKGYSFDKIPPFSFGNARCIECVFWMWW
jgi:hypothetical protein